MSINESEHLKHLSLFKESLNKKNFSQFVEYLPLIEKALSENPHYTKPRLDSIFHTPWNETNYHMVCIILDKIYPFMSSELKVNDLVDFITFNTQNHEVMKHEQFLDICNRLLDKQDFEIDCIRSQLLECIWDFEKTELLSLLENRGFSDDVNYYHYSLLNMAINYDDSKLEALHHLFELNPTVFTQAISEQRVNMRSFIHMAFYGSDNSKFFEQLIHLGGRFSEKEWSELSQFNDSKIKLYQSIIIEEEKKQLESIISEKNISHKKLKL